MLVSAFTWVYWCRMEMGSLNQMTSVSVSTRWKPACNGDYEKDFQLDDVCVQQHQVAACLQKPIICMYCS